MQSLDRARETKSGRTSTLPIVSLAVAFLTLATIVRRQRHRPIVDVAPSLRAIRGPDQADLIPASPPLPFDNLCARLCLIAILLASLSLNAGPQSFGLMSIASTVICIFAVRGALERTKLVYWFGIVISLIQMSAFATERTVAPTPLLSWTLCTISIIFLFTFATSALVDQYIEARCARLTALIYWLSVMLVGLVLAYRSWHGGEPYEFGNLLEAILLNTAGIAFYAAMKEYMAMEGKAVDNPSAK